MEDKIGPAAQPKLYVVVNKAVPEGNSSSESCSPINDRHRG
jgi:hypothetical protein